MYWLCCKNNQKNRTYKTICTETLHQFYISSSSCSWNCIIRLEVFEMFRKGRSGLSWKKQWVFASEAVGFQPRRYIASGSNVLSFGLERALLRVRTCSSSGSNVRFFRPEHIDVPTKTYGRISQNIWCYGILRYLVLISTPVGNRTLIWRTGIFHSIRWTTGAELMTFPLTPP